MRLFLKRRAIPSGCMALRGNFRPLKTPTCLLGRLIRQGILVRDPVVEAAVRGHAPDVSVRSLQYPVTLTIGILNSCRMLHPDDTQPREEQLTMANGDSTHASGAFAS